MEKGKITVLIGGQYGSEGKGAIIRHIADNYGVHVRVGSYNAGHTFYWSGDKHVMQAIPCGWINPDAEIVIGRGAIVPVEGLLEEIRHIEKYYPDFTDRLFIDPEAGVLDKKYEEYEGGKDGWLNTKIGSTGEGCGAARVARMNRDSEKYTRWGDVAHLYGLNKCLYANTPKLIATAQANGENTLIEGTQGSGLSLVHSNWPYCTSIDTNAAGVISEVGIAPTRVTDVLLVCRSYPIRVAGNSGPMQDEISWEDLGVKPEITTVTKKVRRVARWDDKLFENSVLMNDPSEVALTFADYIDPNVYGLKGKMEYPELPQSLREWISSKSPILSEKIKYIGTGPDSVIEITK
jgi:adenylosuccinate synthase